MLNSQPKPWAPRILVEPSDYFLRNFGDMAMLFCAVQRLQTVLPGAIIEVCTEDPDALLRLCPSVIPVAGNGRFQRLKEGYLPVSLRRFVPRRIADRIHRRIPTSIASFVENWLRERSEFAKSLKTADLLLLGGMGGITDYFGDFAEGLLKSLETGIKMDRPVVLVGQGLGPLENSHLRRLAAAILPRVDLIGLREKRAGLPLLQALGVDVRRVHVTGDDAIEFAYNMRVKTLGSALGVNLRRARYSGVDSEVASRIGQAIKQFAAARDAALIPVPIQQGYDCDIEALRSIEAGTETELDLAANITSLEELIRQVRRCRLIITGSYHAGVFALANGIPVLGIAASGYYVDKFEGLADMFGKGCRVFRVGQGDRATELRSAAEELWENAEQTRPSLLAAAERQIAMGREAYDKIADLARKSTTGSSPTL